MKYRIIEDSFENMARYRGERNSGVSWPNIFMLPDWLETWWRFFGSGAELTLLTVLRAGETIGIAPLSRRDGSLSFVGCPDLCDYMDFVAAPGACSEFLQVLFEYLAGKPPGCLELQSLRPDSVVLNCLPEADGRRGFTFTREAAGLSLELDLPATWEEYLDALGKKQRHEIRRKLRRLHEAGEVRYFTVDEAAAVREHFPVFLDIFVRARRDKAAFMSGAVEGFFRAVVEKLSALGLVRLGILELNRETAAMVLLFDYNGTVYLYNSCYDPRFQSLSAGLLCKVFSVREAIESGKQRYDFLKGGEPYKYRLGGRELPLFNCRVLLDAEG